MTLDPILSAPFEVQLHVAAALLALALGPLALYRTRRDRVHKCLGYVWVTAMGVLAVSGLFIEAVVLPLVGRFGPIHLFSIWALVSLWQAMAAIFRRDVARHQAVMRALYWQAIGITGLLALLPGRRMNAVLFGEAEWVGLWGIAVVALGVLADQVRRRMRLVG
ncbi:DUF2306 domain-containing protein [Gymnodinialimonas ulvae]|uniref:DUF2306 domain-containing protein n=1 Tax=Gymnodinialimonas ulvae TaxID=3126504 RepID=UPI0030992963